MTNDDQYYINKVINGDINAFAVLVDRYKDLVFTLSLRLLKNREEAEEVSQDAFIKAYNSLSKFKGESKFSTWIYKIAYHKSLDRIKKNKKYQKDIEINEYTYSQLKTFDNALERLQKNERNIVIQDCVNRLPGDDCFLLTLFYFEELTLEEISETMGISSNNVKVKLFRARKKLASVLKQTLEPEIIESYERTRR